MGETQPFGVTLSAAKGLSPWAESCFAALSMTQPFDVTLSAAKGLSLGRELLRCAQHDKAVVLPLLPPGVTLSAAKGLSPWAESCFAATP